MEMIGVKACKVTLIFIFQMFCSNAKAHQLSNNGLPVCDEHKGKAVSFCLILPDKSLYSCETHKK